MLGLVMGCVCDAEDSDKIVRSQTLGQVVAPLVKR